MPAPTTLKAKTGSHSKRRSPKTAGQDRHRRGPSFGEWVKKYAGIVKNAPPDLSMREGFGD